MGVLGVEAEKHNVARLAEGKCLAQATTGLYWCRERKDAGVLPDARIDVVVLMRLVEVD